MMRQLTILRAAVLALCAAALHAPAHAAPQLDATFELGRQYRHGADMPRDSARAYALIESAARAGHSPAMFIAAAMLATGEGVRRDVVLARRWLEAAAELENPEAMQQLAMNLREGAPGFERDEQRAAQLLDELAHAMKHRAH